MIQSLAYLGITTPSYEQWATFGPDLLGLELAPRRDDGTVLLRMDDSAWRLALHPGERDDVAYIGWNVPDAKTARALADRLAEYGVQAHEAPPETAAARAVEGLLAFTDPFGLRHELSWGRDHRPATFRPGRPLSGFKTGEQGMGHIVLLVPDLAQADDFFSDALGFRLSDRIVIGGKMQIRFYHVNGRHHTLAIAEAPGVTGLQHLMLETNSLDDVGTALDLCERNDVPLALTLGRHVNDLMTSFYLHTPAAFQIEYGFGGIAVDDLSWESRTFDRFSIWGHHPTEPSKGLPPALITRAEQA
ncbi:VOC family protein [Streptomyces sp. NPDC056105]|uniref:VOC family protein n=1 Tax=Streptomyces sp. NPDC056105 TaxID=3345714 RepID=UPI0035D61A45